MEIQSNQSVDGKFYRRRRIGSSHLRDGLLDIGVAWAAIAGRVWLKKNPRHEVA